MGGDTISEHEDLEGFIKFSLSLRDLKLVFKILTRVSVQSELCPGDV